jgi:hypothetical protein
MRRINLLFGAGDRLGVLTFRGRLHLQAPVWWDVFQIQIPFEVMNGIGESGNQNAVPSPLPPNTRFQGPYDQVIIANYLGKALLEREGKHVFQLILMRDQNFAIRAVSTMFIDYNYLVGLDRYHERHFTYSRYLAALGTSGTAQIFISIQDKPVMRSKLTKFWGGVLGCHL